MEHDTIPNHHRHHGGFAGFGGLLMALRFLVGRSQAAALASRLAKVGPDDAVVDVGCGPGVAARKAASSGASVVGIDPAPVMLRVARLFRTERVRYETGAAESLPLPDTSATVVWSLSTVHHWHDIDTGLREAHRVLRPGGTFLALEKVAAPGATGHASHGWTRAQADAFAERLLANDFTDVAVDRHPGKRELFSVRGVAAPR